MKCNDGEIVALIGANGAGKSTTLKTLSGLLHSRERQDHLSATRISPMSSPTSSWPEGLAHVPEGRRIFLQMTVQENLEMGAYICKKFSRGGPGGRVQPLPPAAGAPQPDRRDPFRR